MHALHEVSTPPAGGRSTSHPPQRSCSAHILLAAKVVLLVLGIGYLGLSAVLARQVMIPERHAIQGTPADLGLPYESVSFESADDHIPLRGWYLPASGQRAVVLVHGLDGNRWETSPVNETKALTQQLVQHGFDVVLFDLRGHGESGGERVGLGWFERRDVFGAVSLVEQRGIAPGRIGLWGESFGAATALLEAADDPRVAAVVEDCGFADVRPILDSELQRKAGLPPLSTPGIAVFASAFAGLDLSTIPPERHVAQIAPRPILFIHGAADARIPVEHGYRLQAAAANPADELWVVPGAGHGESFDQQPAVYLDKVVGFFERYVGAPAVN
jgi:uncharacterized protein